MRGEQQTELETITLPKEEAAQKWHEAIEAEKVEQKTANRKVLGDMRRAYYYLKKGHKVLDLFETFKATGLNTDGDPKLAIVPIEAPRCHFQKENPGRGIFSRPSNGWKDRAATGKTAIRLPDNTFPAWPARDPTHPTWDLMRKSIEAPTPVIPPKHVQKGDHLYLLWEVEHWIPAAPKDPLLLRRISNNLFVIYAHWNTTKLERAIIRGRL